MRSSFFHHFACFLNYPSSDGVIGHSDLALAHRNAAAMDTRASKRRGGGGADCGVDTGAAGGAGGSAVAVSLGGGSGEDGHFASPSDGPPEDPLPGYGAGYDAGFQAGLLAASQGVVQPPPLPPGPAAAEGGAGASAPAPARPPVLALVEDFPLRRAPGGAELGAQKWVPVEPIHVFESFRRAPARVAVVAGAGLPVELVDVQIRSYGRAPGGSEVGAGAQLPVG